MKDQMTLAEYRKLKSEKFKNAKHYSNKGLYESESEKKYSEFDMINFANSVNDIVKKDGVICDHIRVGIAEQRQFEKVNKSKMQ